MGTATYLQRSLLGQLRPARLACPNCGHRRSHVVDRKYVVTQLRRCTACKLLFRSPTDDPGTNREFYETAYAQGFTTDMPTDADLAELKRINFAGGEKDYTYYIGVLFALGLQPQSKVFDYGCSWGYGSYQLAKAGFDVTAFEIAGNRSRYAQEKLDVATVADMDIASTEQAGRFDCFFSAHVLEHVPAPAKVFQYARQLLQPGGLFVSFTPNGSSGWRNIAPRESRLAWGQVHPNFIDDVFLNHSFPHSPRCVGTTPVDPKLPAETTLEQLDGLERSELFFAARKLNACW